MNLDLMARSAYAAYSKSTNNKNFMGKEMPDWESLPMAIKLAWVAAAKQVAREAISQISKVLQE